MHPSQAREHGVKGHDIVGCAYSSVTGASVCFLFGFKYCIGCNLLLLLHSSLVVNGTRWRMSGDGWERRTRTGWRVVLGRGAEVTRVARATAPLCCAPLQEARWEDGNVGGGGVRYYLLLLDMAY